MNTVLCCMLGSRTCCAVDVLGCYQVKTFWCSKGQQMGPSSRGSSTLPRCVGQVSHACVPDQTIMTR